MIKKNGLSLCVYTRISHALGILNAGEGYLDAAVCYIAAGNIHVGLLQHIEDFLGIVVGKMIFLMVFRFLQR